MGDEARQIRSGGWWRWLVLAGAAAPVLYVATVVAGAAVRPGYRHLFHAISELTEAGAPNAAPLNASFSLYNLLAMAAALALRREVRAHGSKSLDLGSWVLLVTGLAGLCCTIFPMDPRTAPTTIAGILHLVAAGLSSIGTMVAVGLFAFGARRAGLESYSTYCWLSLALIFSSGGVAATSASVAHPLMGLAERVTIGAYLQWLLVTSWLAHRGLLAPATRPEPATVA